MLKKLNIDYLDEFNHDQNDQFLNVLFFDTLIEKQLWFNTQSFKLFSHQSMDLIPFATAIDFVVNQRGML